MKWDLTWFGWVALAPVVLVLLFLAAVAGTATRILGRLCIKETFR